jgi:hypothetical protein
MKQIVILGISILFCISCSLSVNKAITCNETEKVKFAYLPNDIFTYSPVNKPEDIVMYDQTKYMTIEDSAFICNLISSIQNLKKSDDTRKIDYRIIGYIYLRNKNKTPLKLFIGNDSLIVFNNKQKKFSNDLINLIESKLPNN